MMSNSYPRLVFPGLTAEDLDSALVEISYKEWCQAAAEVSNGDVYPVNFITPLRAAQDMETDPTATIESGLLVVPDTELATLESAVREAVDRGFFSAFKPRGDSNRTPTVQDASTRADYPKLVFPKVTTEELNDTLSTIERTGWCDLATVETCNGERYPVSFMTPERCKETLKTSAVVVAKGLILVTSTDLGAMEAAVRQAWDWDFFSTLKPTAG